MSTTTTVVRQKAGNKRRHITLANIGNRRSPRHQAGKLPGFYDENVLSGKRKIYEAKDDRIEPLPPPTLPLTQSYVDILKEMLPKAPARPPQQIWPTPATPITWPNDPRIPKGWTAIEVDLDPDDLDAQLARVDVRMANKILPEMFEMRKKHLLKLKAERE